jgi:hypothetical protein
LFASFAGVQLSRTNRSNYPIIPFSFESTKISV